MTNEIERQGCVACGRTSDEIPLVTFEFRGQGRRICPQHLPWLIHDPGRLADKLPGVADIPPG